MAVKLDRRELHCRLKQCRIYYMGFQKKVADSKGFQEKKVADSMGFRLKKKWDSKNESWDYNPILKKGGRILFGIPKINGILK